MPPSVQSQSSPTVNEPGRSSGPQPCTLVIFGGSGDLTRRKLLPAVYNLLLDGLLPSNYAVLGLGRKPLSHQDFRDIARKGIENYSRQTLNEEKWEDFQRRLFYMSGKIDDSSTFSHMKDQLREIETTFQLPGNRIFYLAIPPTSFAPACEGLSSADLIYPAKNNSAFSRLIIEKPIGRDLESAKVINGTIGHVFDESQIYRIDHYLGKETVQNIMVLRFANSIFEPLWNHKYIDHVQITVSEAETLGTRASYYEEAGALRDMVQNHILQLLCLIAMEPPYSLDADVIRNVRMDVLRGLRPIRGQDVEQMTVRAQYAHGRIKDKEFPGYRREEGVLADSTTETFVALKVFVENWRWAGVPFYIRTGKAMPKRSSEIAVQFKEIPRILFNAPSNTPQAPNLLTLRIQPEEGMALRIISENPWVQSSNPSGGYGFQIWRRVSSPIPRGLRTVASGRDGRRCFIVHAARCS